MASAMPRDFTYVFTGCNGLMPSLTGGLVGLLLWSSRCYADLSIFGVKEMGMTDVIIEAIHNGQISTSNISFERLRDVAGRDLGCWNALGRGRSILTSVDQLDQYLYSYGPMTRSQWAGFLPSVSVPSGPFCLIDYGCGQGLGSAIVLDQLGTKLIPHIQNVVLIEPSQMALTRAEAIVSVNKKLDDLSEDDIQSCRGLHCIHIFSNVLDIDGFDNGTLFAKMFSTKGRHTVLAVSHDRNFEGGSDRFDDLEEQIKDEKHRKWYSLESSTITRFNSGNGQPTISWQLHLEVLDGIV
jgi:hypothetical protein